VAKRSARRIAGAVAANMPRELEPQLCWPTTAPPEGKLWFHEIKFNGYRLLCWINADEVVLRTRKGLDWTERFLHLVQAIRALPIESAILDGELVAVRPSGVTSFEDLQVAFRDGRAHQLRYFVFDLLYLDGYDLRNVTLERRKRALAKIIEAAHNLPLTTHHSPLTTHAPLTIQYVDHMAGKGQQFFAECCRHELEGIISKQRDAPYRSGRDRSWLKIKCARQSDFVIGGFTRERGSRTQLGALLLGHFDPQGRLIYVGKVGSGMDVQTLGGLRDKLRELEQPQSPFAGLSRKQVDRSTRWVKPTLVARIQFADWTHDGRLRQAIFRGLREDIAAVSVIHQPIDEEANHLAAIRQGSASRVHDDTRPPVGSRLNDAQLKQLAQVQLTNPQRVLYPQESITKLDLARYYAEVAHWILPHIANRPLTLVRCPEGEEGDRFFQKHAAAGTPEAIARVKVRDEEEERLVVKDLAGLLSLVQMSVLEIHPSGAQVDRIDQPDRMIFDLDPGPDVAWTGVLECAVQLRELLKRLSLTSFVKTTGGKGLHIVVPLVRRHGWEEVKSFSQVVAQHMAAGGKNWLTAGMSKAARQGRIYIDYHRNHRGATAVAAYSTRANPRATVSMPLAWSELSPHIGPDHFTLCNARERLATLEADPWAEMSTIRQGITSKAKRLLKL
jgi:bifunctional non-homologous end joining protein LigD